MAVFYRFQDSGLDDWDKSNNYVQMGFRPGFSIQARELTQLQTVLQAQITALARRFLQSGSLVDAPLSFVPSGTIWSGSLGEGYVYIEPTNKELGYFVYNSAPISFSNINMSPTSRTNVYITWQEIQVNPDGEEHLPSGGYAGVSINASLKDNAQGYANYSAPGASRYQINIIGSGSYIEGGGAALPPNSAIIAYFENNIPHYADTGTQV